MPALKKRPSSTTAAKGAEAFGHAKGSKLHAAAGQRPISELGWTREQAAQVRASLQAFDEDWDAPGMEDYDRLWVSPIARGSVVLVAYPNSDLTTFKIRPALVVQNARTNTGLAQLVVALITSNLSRTGETRVRVGRHSPAGKKMQLLTDSVIVCDVLQTVASRAILRMIGNCPAMGEVDSALRITLGLWL
jgi:mRNA interferase MazF